MTRVSCFIFVIFFLCFSQLHACKAGTIRLRNAGYSAEEFLSCKIGRKVRSSVYSSPQTAGEADLTGHHGGQSNNYKLCWKMRKMKGLHEEIKLFAPAGRRSLDIVPFRFISLERSISWHVPRKKKHDEHPGVYSDYSRPQLSPPSHN